jgi:hypothetical protein
MRAPQADFITSFLLQLCALRCIYGLPEVPVRIYIRDPGRSPALPQPHPHHEPSAHDALTRCACMSGLRLERIRHSRCVAFRRMVAFAAATAGNRCGCRFPLARGKRSSRSLAAARCSGPCSAMESVRILIPERRDNIVQKSTVPQKRPPAEAGGLLSIGCGIWSSRIEDAGPVSYRSLTPDL